MHGEHVAILYRRSRSGMWGCLRVLPFFLLVYAACVRPSVLPIHLLIPFYLNHPASLVRTFSFIILATPLL